MAKPAIKYKTLIYIDFFLRVPLDRGEAIP